MGPAPGVTPLIGSVGQEAGLGILGESQGASSPCSGRPSQNKSVTPSTEPASFPEEPEELHSSSCSQGLPAQAPLPGGRPRHRFGTGVSRPRLPKPSLSLAQEAVPDSYKGCH